MARLILTTPGEDAPAGGNTEVIGTSASGEVITVLSGNVTLDPSFNLGGDTVDLPGNASAYTILREGSNAIISGNGITVTVPIGAGLDVQFDNATLNLRVQGGSPLLGNQVVTTTATQVNPNTPGPTTQTPSINEVAGANDSTAAAQVIDRSALATADNAALFDDSLPSLTINAAISGDNDADFFAITLQAGERLILDIDGTTSNLDSVIRLYKPNGSAYDSYADDAFADVGSAVDYGLQQSLDSLVTFRAPTSGTYFFSVESYGDLNDDGEDDGVSTGTTSGSYKLNVSIGPPASADEIFQEDVDALLSGSSQTGPGLTYAFPNSTSDYTTQNADDYVGFAPFSPVQQAATIQLLQQIANVTNLSFSELADNLESGADLRYAMSDAPDAAYAYYPGNEVGGTAWFNQEDFNAPVPGNYAWMGILHETGHALGLKHGHEFPAVSVDHDSVEYTVMTYRSFPGISLNGTGYINETWGYPQTLMMLDIAALQQLYGADFSYNSGDTTYRWSPTSGQMTVNGSPGMTPGANRVFMTIWDGNGNDTYDLSNYTNAVTIDLRPGEWTTTSQTQLANLGLQQRARGNVANALQFDDDPRSLIENAIGGSGGDTLIANEAANRLTGNGGADKFVWNSTADAGLGAFADILADFASGQDDIDLSAIDAIAGTAANDAFAFIGTAAFHGVAGELRYQVEGGNLRVQGDIDGNSAADFEIVVNNLAVLSINDFVL